MSSATKKAKTEDERAKTESRSGEKAGLHRRLGAHAQALDEFALELLSGSTPFDTESVHDIRVTTKKLRAVWLLHHKRPGIRAKHHQALRDGARLLAGKRDTDVMIAILDFLRRRADPGQRRVLDIARKRLDKRGKEAVTVNATKTLKRLREVFLADRQAWSDPALELNDRDLLEEGLRRTYRKARRTGARALESDHAGGNPGVHAEEYHQWRRWAKYLRYQVEALEAVTGRRIDDLAPELKRLGRYLGRHHDLEILEQFVAEEFKARPKVRRRLHEIVGARDEKLIEQCDAMYPKLFGQPPGAFVGTIREMLGGTAATAKKGGRKR